MGRAVCSSLRFLLTRCLEYLGRFDARGWHSASATASAARGGPVAALPLAG
jgi:hypothetical protein